MSDFPYSLQYRCWVAGITRANTCRRVVFKILTNARVIDTNDLHATFIIINKVLYLSRKLNFTESIKYINYINI